MSGMGKLRPAEHILGPLYTQCTLLVFFFVLTDYLVTSHFYSKNMQYDSRVHSDLSTQK